MSKPTCGTATGNLYEEEAKKNGGRGKSGLFYLPWDPERAKIEHYEISAWFRGYASKAKNSVENTVQHCRRRIGAASSSGDRERMTDSGRFRKSCDNFGSLETRRLTREHSKGKY